MATPDKKQIKKHFYEIPSDIDKLTDAQIQAWAKKTYDQFMLTTKEKMSQEEEGDEKI